VSAEAESTDVAEVRTVDAGVAGGLAVALAGARRASEQIVIPIGALIASALVFSIFLMAVGKSPAAFFELLWRGGFASAFSLQNTLVRAAPLILTALCVAVPAQLGLIIIGGEGALVIGGLTAGVAALPLIGKLPPAIVALSMASAGMLAGALWIGSVGALRHFRGVNETIASLLMYYISVSMLFFFVEGPLRDPNDPNKPSTLPIGAANMVGPIPGSDVHWGLVAGIVAAVVLYVVMARTPFGFAARVTGGNPRAALAQGLPVGRLMILATMIAGGAAGLGGYFEVAAIHGKANASLLAGYGFTGILVSFLARHNPLAIPIVAVLFGGLAAASGLIQRRLGLPDATVLVLQGTIFVVLLISETLYGRFSFFDPEARRP
jgi:general nucleoside transport system permease protein